MKLYMYPIAFLGIAIGVILFIAFDVLFAPKGRNR